MIGVEYRRRPVRIVLDRAAIAHNVRMLSPPGVAVMAMVKGNGYGHGAVAVANTAVPAGASWLGVTLIEEGLQLRRAGLTERILVTTELPAGSERLALAANLTPTVYTEGGIRRISALAPTVQVKVDTGLNRVGVTSSAIAAVAAQLARSGLDVEAVWTHLAKSEDPHHDITATQLSRFHSAVHEIRSAGVHPRLLHAALCRRAPAWGKSTTSVRAKWTVSDDAHY